MIQDVLQTYWGWPIRIQIYFGIAFFLFAMGILFVFIIMVSQFYKKLTSGIAKRHKSRIQNELNLLVSHAVIGHIPDASHRFKLANLKKLMVGSYTIQEVIMTEIISLKRNLLGDGAEYLIRTYRELGLREVSLQKLNSNMWKVQAQGLRELEVMEQYDCHHRFIEFLNDRYAPLRKEARLGLVTLGENPLFFLNSLKDHLSEWEVIFIYKKLRLRDQAHIPNFSKWYDHSNESVVLFAIRMTALFGQIQNIDALQKRLEGANELIQTSIIDAFTKTEAYTAQTAVQRVLKKADSRDLKIACLRYFKSVGDHETISSVEEMLLDAEPLVRFEAVGSLLSLKREYAFENEEAISMSHHFRSPLLA